MARIVHPRPARGRQKFLGVIFRDGFADVELNGQPHLRDALIQHGYAIEQTLEVDPDEAPLFEPLPEAIDGDNVVRLSKPAKGSKKRKAAGGENEADAPQESPAVADSFEHSFGN